MDFLKNYTFSPLVIIRTPVYSYGCYNSSDAAMHDLLKNPLFKSAILLASHSVYTKLKEAEFDYDRLSPKLRSTLRKYYNRMSYRCTPFGLFSGTATLRWSGSPTHIQLGKLLRPKIIYSYEHVLAVTEKYLSSPLRLTFGYKINDTLYPVNGHYRFIRTEKSADGLKNNFYLQQIEKTAALNEIRDYCGAGRTMADMVAFVSRRFDTINHESTAFVERLINEQLLVSQLQPNMIDKEYLDAIWPDLIREDSSFATLTGGPGNIHEFLDAPELNKTYAASGKSIYYAHLNIPVEEGSLSNLYQQELKEALYCLNALVPAEQPNGLVEFVKAFKAKFDRQTLPLMQAIDPEIGVGYEDLASIGNSSFLLKDIDISGKGGPGRPIKWGAAHSLLMKKWRQPENLVLQEIRISREDLDGIANTDEKFLAPNSMAVVFRVDGKHLYVESAGGVSAIALNARFSLFDERIYQHCRDVAAVTQTANKNVVFAEITHYSESHTANIDRKKPVWDYEIPILSGSNYPSEKQIPLSDLYVMVEANRAVLLSKTLNRVVVPVLSSAFNYVRSDLAVFRFLCDLQHQLLKTTLSFDLSNYFPDLDAYPRVTFENTIIYLATWRIKPEIVEPIKNANTIAGQLGAIRTLIATLQLPRYISLNEHDNQLVFDTTDENALLLLIDFFLQGKTVMLSEFPFADEQQGIIIGAEGQKFIGQMVATLYHDQQVYRPYSCTFPKESKPRKFIPGSEWLYCKLYCHPSRANELLSDYIYDLTTEIKAENVLKKWFFIRFNDPDYHIRLRLKIEPSEIGKTLRRLKRRFGSLVSNGILSKFQFEVYERELERYGQEHIDAVESFFHSSSYQVVYDLRKFGDNEQKLLKSAFASIEKMCSTFRYTVDDKIQLFNQLFISLQTEFDLQKNTNEQLKQKVRKFRDYKIFPASSHMDDSCVTLNLFDTELTKLCRKFNRSSFDIKNQLLIDLLHMHCNRLFIDNHRKQEMILYYCLWRHYQSAKALAEQPLNSAYF